MRISRDDATINTVEISNEKQNTFIITDYFLLLKSFIFFFRPRICSMANTQYRLRCQLYGHESDVRSVSAITEYDGIVSGSRDKTARIWRPTEYIDFF